MSPDLEHNTANYCKSSALDAEWKSVNVEKPWLCFMSIIKGPRLFLEVDGALDIQNS